MSESAQTGKADEVSLAEYLISAIITGTVFYISHTYGCSWLAQHVPWLKIISEPMTCILVNAIPSLFGYWSVRDPKGVVAVAAVLVAPPCFCVWLFDSWLWGLIFGLCASGAWMAISNKQTKTDSSNKATKNSKMDGDPTPPASSAGSGKEAGRLVLSVVGTALSAGQPQ